MAQIQSSIADYFDVEQGTEEWLAERIGFATASNFNKVMMGKTTAGYQGYVAEIALEIITNRPVESYHIRKTPEMIRGNELEPLARLRYRAYIKQNIETVGIYKHKQMRAAASPDGLVSDDGLVEIKCPLAHNHLYTLKQLKVPSQYIWQVYGQMWLTERLWCDFVSFSDEFPKNSQMAIVHVDRDESQIEYLKNKLAAFLQDVEEAVKFIESYGVQI